jgi:hypothetical protein
MFGSIYFGQVAFGYPGAITGVKRLLRASMRLLNGMRTMRQVRS